MDQDGVPEFEGFYREHFGAVARVAYLAVGESELARDISQEAFVRTWQRWERVGARENPLWFTFRVARNLATSHLRRVRVLSRKRRLVTDVLSPASDVEMGIVLRSALLRLSPRQRWAVVLSDYLDLPSDEVASILGISPATVRVHLARGHARLREFLGEEVPLPNEISTKGVG